MISTKESVSKSESGVARLQSIISIKRITLSQSFEMLTVNHLRFCGNVAHNYSFFQKSTLQKPFSSFLIQGTYFKAWRDARARDLDS